MNTIVFKHDSSTHGNLSTFLVAMKPKLKKGDIPAKLSSVVLALKLLKIVNAATSSVFNCQGKEGKKMTISLVAVI